MRLWGLFLFALGIFFCSTVLGETVREHISNYSFDEAKVLLEDRIDDMGSQVELACLLFDCLHFEASQETLKKAINSIGENIDETELGKAQALRSIVFSRLHRISEASKCLDRADDLFAHPRGPSEASLLKLTMAALDFEKAKNIQALELALDAASYAKMARNRFVEARAYLLIGERGPYPQRLKSLLRALDLSTNYPLGGAFESRVSLALATHLQSKKRYEEALGYLLQSSEKLQSGVADPLIVKLRFREGLLRNHLERWAGAIRALLLARKAAKRLDDSLMFARTSYPLIKACRARNILKEAVHYGQEGLAALEGIETRSAGMLRKKLEKEIASIDSPK